MSSVTTKPQMVLRKEKDPLEIDAGIQIKHEIHELGDFKVSARTRCDDNRIIVKQEIEDNDLNNEPNHFSTPETQKVIPVKNWATNKINQAEIMSFNRDAKSRENDSSIDIEGIKKEMPCNCMQNVQYYCNKCQKILNHINKAKQCRACNKPLKLQCRLCQKRYKLLRRVGLHSISADVKKEEDIQNQDLFSRSTYNLQTTERRVLDEHLLTRHEKDCLTISDTSNEGLIFCYKCDFSTKLKRQLNYHILKTHWQPKSEVINCDDMYIELLCKKCEKICRKVAYNNYVKLVCRECQIPMLYRCTLCCKSYKLLKNVRSHVKSVCPYRTDNERFYCADCTFKTETKAKLENHIVKKHLKQECLECHQILENNDALKEHRLQNCPAKTSNIPSIKLELPCNEPIEEEEKFVVVEYMSKDLLRGLKGKAPKDIKDWGSLVNYLCLKCGDEAKKKFARYRPWCRKCNLKYDYRCIKCEKLYGNYDRILHHVQASCPDRMMFQCPLCKYEVSKKGLLFSHLQNEHTIYKCMECFTNVEGYSGLKKHQSTDCCKDHPRTSAELEKLISLYCKQCCKKPRRTTEECGKCSSILSHQCLRCLNVFDNRDFAYKHIKESCQPNFHCDQCTFKTYTQEGLDNHAKYKHMKRVCSDCGTHFKDELIFQLHRKEEMRRKKYNLGALPAPNSKRLKAS